jgi:hypothetical protein
MRRRIIVKGFNDIGLPCREPRGAFYAFPSIAGTGLSSEEFCEKLLWSKHVAVVPGTAFGRGGEGFIRASYCYSTDHIKEALCRIEAFLKEIKDFDYLLLGSEEKNVDLQESGIEIRQKLHALTASALAEGRLEIVLSGKSCYLLKVKQLTKY